MTRAISGFLEHLGLSKRREAVPLGPQQPRSGDEWSAGDETLQKAAARRRALGGTETILLVEDDAGLLCLIGIVLERYGYTVLAAHDAKDAMAIEARHAGEIHLLVSDLIMPGLNGPGLAQRLVAHRPAIRVLFISGYATDTTTNNLASSPNISFLPKPFDPEILAKKVRQRIHPRVAAPRSEHAFGGETH